MARQREDEDEEDQAGQNWERGVATRKGHHATHGHGHGAVAGQTQSAAAACRVRPRRACVSDARRTGYEFIFLVIL